MNTSIAVLIGATTVSLLVHANADPNEKEQAFLEVPGSIAVTAQGQLCEFARNEIPPDLLKLLEQNDLGGNGDGLPQEIQGFIYDLNKDGKPEYFIYDRMGSGSGGSAFWIISQTHKGWREIGGFQGSLHIFPLKKGWPKMVSTTRGGGGYWTKCYMEFKNDSYKDLYLEHYDRGEITWERLPRK